MKFKDMPYKRVDFEETGKKFNDLEHALDEAESAKEQLAVHEKYYELTSHVTTQMTLAEIRHDIDTQDAFYQKEQDFYDENSPVFRNLCVSYQRKLYQSPFRDELEEKIGKVAFKNIELGMKSVDPSILDLMQEENALETQYNELLSTAKIDWHGEVLNLSLMNPYLNSKDRNVRKEAWEAYTQFFADHKEKLDDLYDRLVKNRTQQGQRMGYDNYLPLGDARMVRNCYTRNDMAEFRKHVKKDFVPFTQKLEEKKRRRLNVSHLYYFDEGVYFPQGNPCPEGTPEEILEAGRKLYHELSPETGQFMDFMCDNELFDVLGRKTKKTGGYMTYLPDFGSPFIFANFNGTTSDVDVITHECGHAFQWYLVKDDPIREHWDITMETAETHSMSMEFFTEPWMDLFFGNRADDYVAMHFEDAMIFIPYGTMVDEFQEIMYQNPSLSPKERNNVWLDLEKQYRPHMDYQGNSYWEAGGFWQKQHHIYDCPLYYIDYCIAQVNALQYRIWMKKDWDKAWQSYLKLCRLSASDFFHGLIRKAGLLNPFEDGCLAYMVRCLEEEI